MTLKSRLDKLEKALSLEGVGPYPGFPVCPPGFDPEAWYRDQGVSYCLKLEMEGKLPPGEYLPGMRDEEKRQVDRWRRLFAILKRLSPP